MGMLGTSPGDGGHRGTLEGHPAPGQGDLGRLLLPVWVPPWQGGHYLPHIFLHGLAGGTACPLPRPSLTMTPNWEEKLRPKRVRVSPRGTSVGGERGHEELHDVQQGDASPGPTVT